MTINESFRKLLSLYVTETVLETGIYFLSSLLLCNKKLPDDIYLDRGDHLVLKVVDDEGTREFTTRITGYLRGDTTIKNLCTDDTQIVEFKWNEN